MVSVTETASGVVKEWSEQRILEAMTAERLSGAKPVGVSDGSQRGRNVTYGWVMLT